MGADGGTIPTRDELVKLKKKPTRADKDVALDSRWQRCALTSQPLEEPVVACGLGRFYNKEGIVQFLLDKEKFSDQAVAVGHIRGLKDVMTLKLTPNKGYNKSANVATTAGAYADTNRVPFACPVTDLPMNGHYKFCFIKSCGCVLSDKAMREIPSETCLKCGQEFQATDVLTLNPEKEEEDDMWAALQAARKSKGGKKSSKRDGKRPPPSDTDGQTVKKVKTEEIQGSDVFKSLFIDPKRRAEMEKGETFTARAVHGSYIR